MSTPSQHQASYLVRQRLGLQTIPQPWHWLTAQQLTVLTKKAYQTATWRNRLECFEGGHFTDQSLREFFVGSLIEEFTAYVTAQAHEVGGCWPKRPETRAAIDRVNYNETEVPQGWRPQYPAYKKVAPASAANASGAVTNADEGNVNVANFRP